MSDNQIIVKPTCIIITNYELGSKLNLERSFRTYDQRTHSYEYIAMKYDPETKNLYVPRGVDLWYLQSCFNVQTSDIIFTDPSPYGEMSAPVHLKFGPRDEVQEEAVRFTMCVGEYAENAAYSQLSVNLNTGKGKTYVSVFTMVASNIKSMVIATIKDWLYQWKDAILEYTDIDKRKVCVLTGAQSISMILSGKSHFASADIFLVTHSTIKSYGDTYGWDKIDKLMTVLKIGNLFIDEAHKNFTNICNINYAINVKRTYFITATPARSDEEENRIYQLCMKNVPGIDLFNEDEDPHTAYIAIKYNSKPTAEQISDCRNMYGLDRNKYINYVIHQKTFYDMLHIVMDLVLKWDRGNDRFLFYLGTNAGILTMYNWLTIHYPETAGCIGIYTSLVPNKETEKYKKYILSTTKSAAEAADFRGLRASFVLAEPFKSEVIARQTLGRTRANNTMYVELVDIGFKKINEWYYEKLPVFNKYATSIKNINMTPIELEERAGRIEQERMKYLAMGEWELADKRFEIPANEFYDDGMEEILPGLK